MSEWWRSVKLWVNLMWMWWDVLRCEDCWNVKSFQSGDKKTCRESKCCVSSNDVDIDVAASYLGPSFRGSNAISSNFFLFSLNVAKGINLLHILILPAWTWRERQLIVHRHSYRVSSISPAFPPHKAREFTIPEGSPSGRYNLSKL